MAEAGGGPESRSDRFLDAVCLIGSIARCRERLRAFMDAGLDLPILMPPVDVDGTRQSIDAVRGWVA